MTYPETETFESNETEAISAQKQKRNVPLQLLRDICSTLCY